MPRLYDHIDLRVHSLAEARTFYESLLPALGFTRKTEIPGWLQFEAEAPDGGPAAFFGVTESTGHVPNESRIAFWVETRPNSTDSRSSPPAPALGTSKALVGRMKPTTPPFLKIPAATAWKSATARRL
jgi:catechol 2,3-dioxygenase-like lactoylglutathione lyase family enzyme